MEKAALVRIIGLVIILVNAILTIMGVHFVIPENFGDVLASVLLVIASLYAAIKNDFFGKLFKKKDAKEEPK
jgi:phage-related protein